MADAIRAELDKILSSRPFSGAERATNFLRFVVGKTLSGEADQLKEYVLALEVLGRKPSFDPRTDPIVRVEAGRLRARLEEYYRTEGSGDGLLITLPKGGYVPTFEMRRRKSRARAFSRLWLLLIWGIASAAALLLVAWYASRFKTRVPELIEQRLTSNSFETPVTATAVSLDGKYLAYADQIGIHLRLIATAETHTLAAISDSKIVQLRWFPDGTKLLASVTHRESLVPSVWSVSILGGAPRKLREGAEYAVVSSTEFRIAFVDGRGSELWVMESGGERPRRILTVPGEDSILGVAWSLDGEHLAFVRAHQAIDRFERTINYCDISGAERRTLVLEPSLGRDLVLLKDRLVYTRSEPSPRQTDTNLWETSFDYRTGRANGRPKRITSWSGFSVFGLTITLDGKHWAFLKGQTQADVYVADVQGSPEHLTNARRLTFDERNDIPFAWTPDSKAVIFVSDRNGFNDIFKQDINLPAAEAIVAGPENKWVPTVSAAGAWIVYLASTNDKQFPASGGTFSRVPISGGPVEAIMKGRPGSIVQCPRSSACVLNERSTDGKQLFFYAFNPLLGKGRELARMDTDLVSFYNWSISPDGSLIAVLLPGEGDGRIRVLPTGGGDMREVTVKNAPNLTFIDWAADGKGWYSARCLYCGGHMNAATSFTLLYVGLQGRAHVVGENVGWAVPSPDGHHLALAEWNTMSNVWMVEGF
jgi:Tol biopolymer transport system component